MENIEKLKSHILDMSGNNYRPWCLDIELHLQGQDLVESLIENGKEDQE